MTRLMLSELLEQVYEEDEPDLELAVRQRDTLITTLVNEITRLYDLGTSAEALRFAASILRTRALELENESKEEE